MLTFSAFLALGAIALLVSSSFALGAFSRMPRRTRAWRLGVALSLTCLLVAHGLGWMALQGFVQQVEEGRLRAAGDAMATDTLAYLARRCDSDRRLTLASTDNRVLPDEGVLLDAELVRRPVNDNVPPVDWFDPIEASQVLASSMFVFVEQDRRMTSRGAISVTAHRLWWEQAGRDRMLPENAAEFMARLVQVDLFRAIEGPVRESTARYLLKAADASTLEDRSHGVARIELQLFDRRRGAPMAEYVGFAADLLSAHRPQHGLAWRGTQPCSGAEQGFTTAETGFDAIGFFLMRAVRIARDRPRLTT